RRESWIALAVVGVVLASSLGGYLYTFAEVRQAQPLGRYDAMAIWNARALLLHRAEGDVSDFLARMRFGHPDYPLLLPGAIAGQWGLVGREATSVVQLTALFFALGTLAAVAAAVSRYGSWAAAGAAAALLLSVPAFWRWSFAQVADVPLAYFLLTAALTLGSQLEEPTGSEAPRVPPALAGLFLGLLAWIKNEGLILAAILLAAWGLTALRRPPPVWRLLPRLGAVVWGAAPALLALLLFKTRWSPENETARFLEDLGSRIIDGDRWRAVAAGFWRVFDPTDGMGSWGVIWLFLGACAVFSWRARRRVGAGVAFWGTALLAAYAGWFFVYLATPHDVRWHLATSHQRLMLQLLPLSLAWAAAGIRPAGDEGFSINSPPMVDHPPTTKARSGSGAHPTRSPAAGDGATAP
ncbi:MAG: hypothetical protein MI919_25780, partial [Holophagales bacterium]|nr:hypothetical protein [Holophagales bacterium]